MPLVWLHCCLLWTHKLLLYIQSKILWSNFRVVPSCDTPVPLEFCQKINKLFSSDAFFLEVFVFLGGGKMRKNPISAPRTPLGELTTLTQTPSRLGRGYPLSIPSPIDAFGVSIAPSTPRWRARRTVPLPNTNSPGYAPVRRMWTPVSHNYSTCVTWSLFRPRIALALVILLVFFIKNHKCASLSLDPAPVSFRHVSLFLIIPVIHLAPGITVSHSRRLSHHWYIFIPRLSSIFLLQKFFYHIDSFSSLSTASTN